MEGEAYRDDVLADHAVLLVSGARTAGVDAPLALKLEADGHRPSVRLVYLAFHREGVVVVDDVPDVARVA